MLDNSAGSGICRGVTVVLGRNGSGKSTLGSILAKGRYAYGNRLKFNDSVSRIKMLTFTDIHSFTGIDVQHHTQRMEATANDYVLMVGEIFKEKMDSQMWRKYSDAFRLTDVETKKINYLSSGELRKLLIINALCDNPDLLILDNPYIGLDAASRMDFDEAMMLLRGNGVSAVFLMCDPAEVPPYVDSVIEMDNCKVGYPVTDKEKISGILKRERACRAEDIVLPVMTTPRRYEGCEIVFAIKDGHARYGDKVIFERFNWTVRRGECWSLCGPNGSGKSLLLSMICADNPQGYANDITLFDRKRGSGESIWEIKDAIGYVCPEMQLYFKSNIPVKEIIVQGMRNSLNRYGKATAEELNVEDRWLNILNISHLGDRKFSELSSGEQRIVLLAGALAKQPALLVLDEPLHGLDPEHKTIVKRVISALTEKAGTTLIFVTHCPEELPDCISHSKTIRS
ncbi:MAG: ATP-binding cassette domain-containing protein [Muribaculaceae bacterium]|nr:ATP-binding cassette domain-containing protein [Muribaculaceae bacterium]